MTRRFQVSGIVTALLTPLSRDKEILEEETRKLIRFQIERGISGFYVLGTTGEGVRLNSKLRKDFAELVIRETRKKIPVIIHVGASDLDTVMDLARHAEDAGADAVASVPPFYYQYDVESLVRFYSKLSSITSLPIIIYNFPERVGYRLGLKEFSEIFKRVEGIVGVKNTVKDITLTLILNEEYGGEKWIASGYDTLIYHASIAGIRASVSALSNLVPELTVSIKEKVEKGELEEARRLQLRLDRLSSLITEFGGIPALKEAIKLRGINAGIPAPPQRQLSEEEKNDLFSRLKRLGIGREGS